MLGIGVPAGAELMLTFVYMAVIYTVIRGFGSTAQAGFGVGVRMMQAVQAQGLKGENHDQDIGIKIVLRAMEQPLREIMANAGLEPSVVLNKVREKEGNYGFNAQTGEYGDMIEMGVLDPTKVVRVALQNATSIAGLMITTEVMIAEAPKKEMHATSGVEEMYGY